MIFPSLHNNDFCTPRVALSVSRRTNNRSSLRNNSRKHVAFRKLPDDNSTVVDQKSDQVDINNTATATI